MEETEKEGEAGGTILLFAMLDMLDFAEEPAMGQAISKMKDLVRKMNAMSSYHVLRLKMRALLKARDEVLLRRGGTSIPSVADKIEPRSGERPAREPETHASQVQVPIGQFLDRLLNLMEDTSHTTDQYTSSLDIGLANLRASQEIKEIRELTKNLIGSASTMKEATVAFQAGIAEMATMMFDFQRKVKALEEELEEQREIALVDKLTGVHNRRAFDMRLEELIAQSRRFHTPLCLFLIDMDHFKDVNDKFGHEVGDEVLTSFARLLRTSCREYDMVFRFGGDEFAVIFPNEGLEEGKVFANRIQNFMSHNYYRHKDHKISMSVSGGMAQLTEDDDAHSLFSRADKRLYQAKAMGRNRFRFDE